MKIRNKILVYFSSAVIVLSALSLVTVFILFAEHREEEFQQQQFAKINYTVGLVEEFNKMSEEVSLLLDKQNIHDFYDEKLLIYDHTKKLIFSSIDSLDISMASKMLHVLSVSNNWIETKEDGYDLIGVYLEHNSKSYYAISKAYDMFGHSKKDFLQKVLWFIFVCIVIVVLLLSFYLSSIISKPISELTAKMDGYDLSIEDHHPVEIETTTTELQNLSEKFNQLTKRTHDAFLFQKYSIQHISHELKTPIAILVSELEKLENMQDIELMKSELHQQILKAKSLGSMINVLLQIAKIDSGQEISRDPIRIDDIIFDCIAEVTIQRPEFNFEVHFTPLHFNEEFLTIIAHKSLIRQAFLNLFINAVQYATNQKAKVVFDCSSGILKVSIHSLGETLSKDEQKFLFSHFFRGKNVGSKQGSGLGLVLSKRIFSIHHVSIRYYSLLPSENVFELTWDDPDFNESLMA